MPTYSYRCANCGYEFDQYQSFTDDALTVCPNCGEPKLRKVFNSIGVTFNGSGFYHNDSKASSSLKPEKKSESKSETKSDSAPSTPPPAPKSSDTGSSS